MKHYSNWFWLTLFCCCAGVSSAQQMESAVATIEDALEREVIGAAVLSTYVAGDSNTVGFGQIRSDDASVPNENTVFEIGSITKVFTALLTQVLVDSEQLSWADSIATRLPDVHFTNSEVGAITLVELATHTSGLPRLPDNINPSDGLDPYADYGPQELLAFLSGYNPDTLDKTTAYSNLGMGLLGFIAARTVGLEYPAALAEYVLGPLQMSNTTATYDHEALNPDNLASGYSDGAEMPRWTFDALAGAGSMLSTSSDLLTFIRHATLDDPQGVAKSLQATLNFGTDAGNGLAWQVMPNSSGNKTYWHNGGTGGYASFMGVDPIAKQGWVLLTSSTAYQDVTVIGQSLTSPPQPADPSLDLSPYLGVYQLAENFHLTITEMNNQLHAQATGQGAFPLTYTGTEHSFAFDAAQITIQFETPNDGMSAAMQFSQGGQNTEAKRVDAELATPERTEIPISAQELLDYVGKYQLAPGVIITATARDNQLFLQLTGQPVIPVFAMAKDRFFFKIVDAEVQFERQDGAVGTLVLFQNGEHRAERTE